MNRLCNSDKGQYKAIRQKSMKVFIILNDLGLLQRCLDIKR